MRTKLPNRRHCLTTIVIHKAAAGNEETHLVSVGLDDEVRVREVFCANRMVGSDMHAIMTDGCILLSIYLQSGGELEKLVKTLGENRLEGDNAGLPSSVFGSIARTLLQIETEITAEITNASE